MIAPGTGMASSSLASDSSASRRDESFSSSASSSSSPSSSSSAVGSAGASPPAAATLHVEASEIEAQVDLRRTTHSSALHLFLRVVPLLHHWSPFFWQHLIHFLRFFLMIAPGTGMASSSLLPTPLPPGEMNL